MTDWSEPLFLLGPGYSGRTLAKIWPGDVYGTVRSRNSRETLSGTSIEPIDMDDAAEICRAVKGAHIVISAPPDEEGCPGFRLVGAMAYEAASITYLSTTGVYGNLNGGWAMEWSVTNAQSKRAIRRRMAEQVWQEAVPQTRLVRLPGIYGPGRSAFDRLRAGKARRIIRPGQVFSRAHVDDIARGLSALIQTKSFGIFNLCDDEAAPPQDVIAYAAELINVPVPNAVAFESAELSEMGRSFYTECKRVSNAKIKAATGWRPQFPTYREGLKAILDAGA